MMRSDEARKQASAKTILIAIVEVSGQCR